MQHDARPGLLEISDLRIGFGSAPVVDGVSLSLAAGETLGIVGESGCGKSILSLSILGLLPAGARILSGNIRLEGRELTQLSARDLRSLRGDRISMVFQEPMTALNPVLTIGSQLSEVFRIHRGVSRQEARAMAVEALRAVGVASPETRIRNYPAQLSGGMRQRVMIAMALACRPQILIADEPTTALDVTIQAQILDLMRNLRKEYQTTILFISHDLGVIAEVSDRVAVLYSGIVVEEATTAELFSNPQHPYTRGLLAALPQPDVETLPEVLFEIPGMVPAPDDRPSGCRFHPRCPLASDQCRTAAPPVTRIGPDHRVACWEAPQ
ncbi:ABC transporter ATP-binding protein [Gemmobacter nectariphilus]|uniref:ABC transporter ATP-binding protein n=1 Tax=Gemmobacter nectariphilus TaxID=220343 RepID=UPI0004022EB1|nr:ABC transporter ATP-binding protein [Gemmobacter nectariphilus]